VDRHPALAARRALDGALPTATTPTTMPAPRRLHIEVVAADGYQVAIESARFHRNDAILLANQVDGAPLPDDQFRCDWWVRASPRQRWFPKWSASQGCSGRTERVSPGTRAAGRRTRKDDMRKGLPDPDNVPRPGRGLRRRRRGDHHHCGRHHRPATTAAAGDAVLTVGEATLTMADLEAMRRSP